MSAPIAVIIPTYNRPDIVIQCVYALRNRLNYSGTIHYYIGNDGEPFSAAQKTFLNFADITILDAPKRGLGANLNHLINATTEPLILQLDDDHILDKPLDLDRHAAMLESNPQAGVIRLCLIAGHHYFASLDGSSYWWLAWTSPELYLCSNRPHLKRRDFHAFAGLYPENVKLGETEEGFCHQAKDRASALDYVCPSVLVPLDVLTESSWQHVGDSWQAKGL